MLLTMIEVLSCENPQCREFARIVACAPEARSYYCQVCGKISRVRAADAALVASPTRYEAHLREVISSGKGLVPA